MSLTTAHWRSRMQHRRDNHRGAGVDNRFFVFRKLRLYFHPAIRRSSSEDSKQAQSPWITRDTSTWFHRQIRRRAQMLRLSSTVQHLANHTQVTGPCSGSAIPARWNVRDQGLARRMSACDGCSSQDTRRARADAWPGVVGLRVRCVCRCTTGSVAERLL